MFILFESRFVLFKNKFVKYIIEGRSIEGRENKFMLYFFDRSKYKIICILVLINIKVFYL